MQAFERTFGQSNVYAVLGSAGAAEKSSKRSSFVTRFGGLSVIGAATESNYQIITFPLRALHALLCVRSCPDDSII